MSADVDIHLYTRVGCHLCDVARADLTRAGYTFTETDVDTDDDAHEQYTHLVPVVTVDGDMIGKWQIDIRAVRAAVEQR